VALERSSMKPQEAAAIRRRLWTFIERHGLFFACWAIWFVLSFFIAGPITDVALDKQLPGALWLLPTLAVMCLPAIVLAVNFPIYWLRSTDDRKRARLRRLQEETSCLERELGLRGAA
jgi:hypothetical protein